MHGTDYPFLVVVHFKQEKWDSLRKFRERFLMKILMVLPKLL